MSNERDDMRLFQAIQSYDWAKESPQHAEYLRQRAIKENPLLEFDRLFNKFNEDD